MYKTPSITRVKTKHINITSKRKGIRRQKVAPAEGIFRFNEKATCIP